MNIAKIEETLKKLISNISGEDFKEDFIFELLLAYGISKTTITLVKKGNSNLAKKDNQLILKKKVFFESTDSKDLYSIIENLKNEKQTHTHKPRFIIVTNFENLLAIDTKTKESLDTPLKDLCKHADFFLPWTGKEKYLAPLENIADVRAAEKMAKIYDEIVKLNPELTTNHNHPLNIFLTRLLFCFFAEDTGIFEDNIFTKTLSNCTNDDGSDLDVFLEQLFESLDKKDKSEYPTYLNNFPYVNGKLFAEKHPIPKMSVKIKKLMVESGEQNWKEINPDIFGSMFQAVASADVRSGLGQHYTSVPNIMKVIEPLFLNDLEEELEKANTENKLEQLLKRIYNIKIFDPACGSGNFLIIAYKQLRLLEIEIIKKIQEVTGQNKLMLSKIQLSQFYGIEIDDFACEIATLSLWLAEHQMNRKFKDTFGNSNPSLPLTASGNIVCGNATRLDWEEICPKKSVPVFDNRFFDSASFDTEVNFYEICILGNPPYAGARKQTESQKSDLDVVFNKFDKYRDLDYISCWFYKASNYIKNSNNCKYAFVSTNSICQGQQVALLWDKILFDSLEINFAYQSFKWGNNAKNNAGVTVVIIGIINKNNVLKTIYEPQNAISVKSISPYLKPNNSIAVQQTKNSISKLPKMNFGNMPNDGGGLILTTEEKNSLIEKYPQSEKYVRLLLGSQEFIRGQERWCLWLYDNDLEDIKSIMPIIECIEKTRNHRLESKDKGTNRLASRPHQFRDTNESITSSIIIPSVSSERRDYIPIGFLDKSIVISNAAQVIYNAAPWVFGIITSHMHMVWVRTVGGQLETRIRYSAEICYNTFPFPEISDNQKKKIEMHVNEVLMEREKHSEKTMAELYDPDKMPEGLRRAHHDLDIAIELCYRKHPFESDEKRLEYLFKMYEIMTNPEKNPNLEQQLSLI